MSKIVAFPTRQTSENTQDYPIYLTITEACKLTGYSRFTVWRRCDTGEWSSIGRGKGRRILASSISADLDPAAVARHLGRQAG